MKLTAGKTKVTSKTKTTSTPSTTKAVTREDLFALLEAETTYPNASYQKKAARIQKRLTSSNGSAHNNGYQSRIIEDVLDLILFHCRISKKKTKKKKT